MKILNQIGTSLWTLIVAIGAIFLYEKFIDKPDTVINNKIGKIKNKGENNDISTSSSTQVSNKQEKKKFKLFKRRKTNT